MFPNRNNFLLYIILQNFRAVRIIIKIYYKELIVFKKSLKTF